MKYILLGIVICAVCVVTALTSDKTMNYLFRSSKAVRKFCNIKEEPERESLESRQARFNSGAEAGNELYEEEEK